MPAISNTKLEITGTSDPRFVTVSYTLDASAEEAQNGPAYREEINLWGEDTDPITGAGNNSNLGVISTRWIRPAAGSHQVTTPMTVSRAKLAEDPDPTFVIRIWTWEGWKNITVKGDPNSDELFAKVTLRPCPAQTVDGGSSNVLVSNFG